MTVTETGTVTGMGTGAEPNVVPLLPGACAARDRLLERGGPLTRDSLAAQLRRDGHAIRNAQVSQLLAALKNEIKEKQAVDAAPPSLKILA